MAQTPPKDHALRGSRLVESAVRKSVEDAAMEAAQYAQNSPANSERSTVKSATDVPASTEVPAHGTGGGCQGVSTCLAWHTRCEHAVPLARASRQERSGCGSVRAAANGERQQCGGEGKAAPARMSLCVLASAKRSPRRRPCSRCVEAPRCLRPSALNAATEP